MPRPLRMATQPVPSAAPSPFGQWVHEAQRTVGVDVASLTGWYGEAVPNGCVVYLLTERMFWRYEGVTTEAGKVWLAVALSLRRVRRVAVMAADGRRTVTLELEAEAPVTETEGETLEEDADDPALVNVRRGRYRSVARTQPMSYVLTTTDLEQQKVLEKFVQVLTASLP